MAFRFKQFSVRDDISSMKVGTDAVLLGAWAGETGIGKILDVGTGCGIIALMMAQRYKDADVLGIDIHPASVEQAMENFSTSPWSNRLEARKISVQQISLISPQTYDLVVSNPPYFKDSLLPPEPSRILARHAGTLNYEELVRSSAKLLKDEGKLALILPYNNKEEIRGIMERHGLKLYREMNIIPVSGKKPNRFLSEWGRVTKTPDQGELVIRIDPHNYTEDYKELTREFYMAL